MAITSVADYELCRSSAQVYSFVKTIPGSTVIGPGCSTRAGGFPANESQVPAAGQIQVLNSSSPGFPPIPWAPTEESNYLISMSFQTTATTTPLVSLYDKLMFGNFTTTTQATIAWTGGLDASSYLVEGRVGRSDFSELQWWIEAQTAVSTAVLTSINVTMDNNATKDIVLTIPVLGAGKYYPIFLDEPGRFIKKINSIFIVEPAGTPTLSIVCTRHIAEVTMGTYEPRVGGPNQHGLPVIPKAAALMLLNFATSAITLTGYIKVGYL